MQIEWDEDKNAINKKKHKISFENASQVFDDPNRIEIYDFEHSIYEERFIAIGRISEVIFVVFTERGENLRLISARVATEAERRIYDEYIYG